MTASRFRALPIEIEAVQWTGDNAAAMTQLAGDRFAEIGPGQRGNDPDYTASVKESDLDEWLDLREGDWVVRREGGWLGVLDDEEFDDRFEDIDADERADADSDVFDLISEIASRLRDATDEGEYHAVGLIGDLANGRTTVAEARAELAELTFRHV